ncbi:hypothetical protein OAO50_03175, partial [Paracoccaceae bacterium]|nr:hypothetical protein [Paracoccaceae bacterium]
CLTQKNTTHASAGSIADQSMPPEPRKSEKQDIMQKSLLLITYYDLNLFHYHFTPPQVWSEETVDHAAQLSLVQ